jgi:hypothetical protein
MDQAQLNREISALSAQLAELDGELVGLRLHNERVVDHHARKQMDALLKKIKIVADRRDRLKTAHTLLAELE